MLTLPGPPALSSFRREQLLAVVRAEAPGVRGVSAQFIHFAEISSPLNDQEAALLGRLLRYGPRLDSEATGGRPILVTPRAGTQSPWSSKATDIARVCGLEKLQRLERGTRYQFELAGELSQPEAIRVAALLHDRMTESVWFDLDSAATLFSCAPARPLRHVALAKQGRAALARVNSDWGMALSDDEIDYLVAAFANIGRDPTDVELMMFAQANSEHCRHKIFNADFIIDGEPMPRSMFAMIRLTHQRNSAGILSAYQDNAAVFAGATTARFFPCSATQRYVACTEPVDVLIKVETHNHPTAISPFPGASTGSGGEIRDEGATGIGAKPKAGLVGFSVSNLAIPGAVQPWERDFGKPERIASALDIMLQAPLGAAAFNNEFGRPNICGYFRSFLQSGKEGGREVLRGYHKPIMLAGGLGNVRRSHVLKREVVVGAPIVVLGGPAMLIGLGGGAASSLGSGQSSTDLDFASVQRGNAEMQRRAQEVIDRCWAMGDDNPILLIHDVGAGGLSNAVPEAIVHSHRGGRVDMRKIPSADPGLSPMELWCNEAQERYVIALAPGARELFEKLCGRERCPYAFIGEITGDGQLVVEDVTRNSRPVDMPIEVLLGKPPRMIRDVKSLPKGEGRVSTSGIGIGDSLQRLLRLPTIADKSFLITIGDRTVGGLVSRDQMVGPWQVPVADVGVTLSGFQGYTGEAMAIGERTPVAVLDAAASGRLAVAEAITNIAAADIGALQDIRLSANWMAACGEPGEDADLYHTVRAVGEELCSELGLTIPVGKDSLSMRSEWLQDGAKRSVLAPISLIVSAFAPVIDARRTLTPELDLSVPSELLLIDLGAGQNRLGGSCFAQVWNQYGGRPADLDEPGLVAKFFALLRRLKDARLLRAYHDRSDGGALQSLLEMSFASRCGLAVDLGTVADPIAACFAEEPGAVVQVARADTAAVLGLAGEAGLAQCVHSIAFPQPGQEITIRANGTELFRAPRIELHRAWSETSYRMQSLRDNPECAREEFARWLDMEDPGLHARTSFDVAADVAAPYLHLARPALAVLREQGVNSQTEMAQVCTNAGFDAYDVHMTDILSGRVSLSRFQGLVACGGFSYGDVLGAGEGWAKSILFNSRAREEFAAFFARPATFTLGVCNGCQMLSALKELIPGAAAWPRFVRNRSEQYEARLSLVTVPACTSVLFAAMHGSVLPIVVSHGEGRAEFEQQSDSRAILAAGQVTLQFVDHYERVTEAYPFNPNGSPAGIAGVTSVDGRVTALMPHPERVYRTVQNSWRPAAWGEDGGWTRLFRNARVFLR